MKHRNKKRMSAALLAFCLAVCLFMGCGANPTAGTDAAVDADAAAETPPKQEEPVKESDVPDEAEQADGTRQITDMAGRELEIPAEVDKVFSTDPVAAIYLYTMDPDRMLGWNYDLNDLEKKTILPEYHDLPSFGMGDSVNYEAVISAAPQAALYIASGDEASVAEADRLSESLGIPVIIASNQMQDIPEVYRLLGELFNEAQRGEELASYVENTFQEVTGADIPDEQKVTIYYGNGENSLETAPAGSTHSEILDFVHAVNVADMETEGGSRVQISVEQLLAWNPEYIIVNGEPKKDISGRSAAQGVLDNPDYATVKAVQDENVFGTPNTPFSWVDRPPGPNRVIGIRWLAKILYPDVYEYDIDTMVKEFYKLFYHLELTDQQMTEVLGL